MKRRLGGALLAIAWMSQVDTASAQYYGPDGYSVQRQPVYRERYYYGGEPAYGSYRKPMGWGEPYPPAYQPDGSVGCYHRNYRIIEGWCQRAW